MSIDITKKYKTRAGLSVDILKIYEDHQQFPVKAYVYPENHINSGYVLEYNLSGKTPVSNDNDSNDLVEILSIDYILQLIIDAEKYFIESHVMSKYPSKTGYYNEACEKIREAIKLLTNAVNEDK